MVAANAPDIDTASYFAGPYAALAFRRGITHGLPALVVLPLLVTALMLGWDRVVRLRHDEAAEPARAGPTLALAYLGVLTHPTLDWMNTYGMRWGLPFDGAWSYGDALFIVDPWIWLTLGGAVFLSSEPSRAWMGVWAAVALAASTLVLVAMPAARIPWLLGVVGILTVHLSRRPESEPARRTVARVAAGAACVYVVVLVAADQSARRQVLAAAEARGLRPQEVMVAPTRGNPFVSDVEVLGPAAYVPGIHRWLGEPTVELFAERAVPLFDAPVDGSRADIETVLAQARARPDVRRYLVWSRYPYVRVERDGTAWQVLHADARYDGVPGAGGLSGVRVRIPTTR